MSTTEFIWRPSEKYLQCRVADFMHVHSISSWQQLIEKSSEDIEWFWHMFSQYAGVQWHRPYDTLLSTSSGNSTGQEEAKDFAWTKWFISGETNIAYNCLDWHQTEGLHVGARESVGADHPRIDLGE